MYTRPSEEVFAVICRIYHEESEKVCGRPKVNGRPFVLSHLARELGIEHKICQRIINNESIRHARRKRSLLFGVKFTSIKSKIEVFDNAA